MIAQEFGPYKVVESSMPCYALAIVTDDEAQCEVASIYTDDVAPEQARAEAELFANAPKLQQINAIVREWSRRGSDGCDALDAITRVLQEAGLDPVYSDEDPEDDVSTIHTGSTLGHRI